MSINELIALNVGRHKGINELLDLQIDEKLSIELYPMSVNRKDDNIFFIGKSGIEKSLYILGDSILLEKFDGQLIEATSISLKLKKCPLNKKNAELIQENFEFTRPVLIGLNNSFGFGDRLGLANAAHIRSLEDSDFMPVLAQQSIRELTRTQRTPDEVMNAAVWAVFQEGHKSGFGADADHLKTTSDIDLMINAGFTMFTFDPGENVINEADSLPIDILEKRKDEIPWDVLKSNYEETLNRYAGKTFELEEGFVISVDKSDTVRAIIKYGKAVAQITRLYQHLKNNYSRLPYEIEVSVDETDSVTTPFEHFFMSSEFNRLNVKIISLAPRFIGDFEKGIDYKGDLDIFKEEYLKHVKIAEYFGSYKISLHSGSDKFAVYAAIGSLRRGYTHVKTAGTSYLEALRVVAAVNPELMREILDFSRELYEIEKNSYHVSADSTKVFSSSQYDDAGLLSLFDHNDARQVLHVTFGKVLTTKKDDESFLFRDRILNCLKENETVHYAFLYKHFRRHLEPFKQLN